jgi:hypothetical protein
VDGRTLDPTKIGIWKDAFHEIRASTMILEAARGLPDAPVDTVDGRPYSE